MITIKNFILLFVLVATIVGCSNKSNSNESDSTTEEVKNIDSLQIASLIPSGFTLLDTHLIDIDQDSIKEYALFFKTTTQIPCDNLEANNCFQNELFIAKKNNNEWIEKYRFLIQNPLLTDSITISSFDFNELNSLTVTSDYRPTCCSNITTKQYYHFAKDIFLLDSLNHQVETHSASEYYSWDYQIDVLQQKCKLSTSHFNPEEDSVITSTASIFNLKITKTPTILSKNSIEDFVPEDSLKHWY